MGSKVTSYKNVQDDFLQEELLCKEMHVPLDYVV